MWIFTVLVIVFFMALGAAAVLYNSLVRKRNVYKNAFAQIDVQLQRRFDLIPNLVASVRRYMAHEQQTLEGVISARNAAAHALEDVKNSGDSHKMRKLVQSSEHLGAALRHLAVVVENYPELKANTNMMHLQEELASTENKVSFARQAYNDAVMSYNTTRESFPQNLIASLLGFAPAALFDLPAQAPARSPVRVEF